MRLRTPLLLGMVIVVGAVLRLSAIGEAPPGLYTDEAANGNDALQALATGEWQWFYPANNGREGLFINLQAIALSVAGEREPWVLRTVSALAGILTIPGMYVLGTAIWNRRAGLLAAALLAGSFWHVHFSRIGFRAILAVLVLTWAFGLLLAGLRRVRGNERFGVVLTAAGGALAGLGLHTYIAFRAMAIPLLAVGALAIWSARSKKRDAARALVLAGIAATIVAAPMLLYFSRNPESFSSRAADVSIFSAEKPALALAKNVGLEVGMLAWKGDGNWRHNYPPAAALPLLLVPFFAYGIWSVFSRAWKTRGRELGDAGVAVLFLAALLPAVLSAEGMPHALRGILLIVPVILATAFGLLRVWYKLEERGWRVAGAVLAACAVLYGGWHTVARYPAYAARYETRDEFTTRDVELGRELRDRSDAEPVYVVVRDTNVTIGNAPSSAQTVMFMTNTASEAAQREKSIFYVTSTDAVPGGARVYDLR